MLRDTAVSQIKEHLGFRTDTLRDSSIVTRMQQAQRLLEKGRSLPRFLVQEDQSLVVTAGLADIAFPTGFIRELEGETFNYLDVENDEQVFLEKMTKAEGVGRFTGADAGKPIAYTIRKGGWSFYPERDKGYTLTYSFYKGADLLTSNIENGWLEKVPDVLIGSAGMIIAEALRDPRAKMLFKEIFDMAWMGMFAHDILNEDENDAIFFGGRL